MKINDFILQWAKIPVTDSQIIINTPDNPQITLPVITPGNTKIKNYNWSYDDRCLYYGDELVCIKIFGIFAHNKKYENVLQSIVDELNIFCYRYDTLATGINKALLNYYYTIKHNDVINPIVLNFVRLLNCKYQDKFLNYCRTLSVDQLNNILSKRKERQIYKPKATTRVLTGLWYKDNSSDNYPIDCGASF